MDLKIYKSLFRVPDRTFRFLVRKSTPPPRPLQTLQHLIMLSCLLEMAVILSDFPSTAFRKTTFFLLWQLVGRTDLCHLRLLLRERCLHSGQDRMGALLFQAASAPLLAVSFIVRYNSLVFLGPWKHFCFHPREWQASGWFTASVLRTVEPGSLQLHYVLPF